MQRQSHSILEELMLPSIEQALFCKRKLHKCLIHRQYVTSLCHNFSSNIWWTSNKTQRFADLVSFVLSAWGNITWNKPDICSARLQVEMCQLLDLLRIRGPTEQHNLWLQSNTLWSHAWVMDSNSHCSTAQVWGWINVRNVAIATGETRAGDHHVC